MIWQIFYTNPPFPPLEKVEPNFFIYFAPLFLKVDMDPIFFIYLENNK